MSKEEEGAERIIELFKDYANYNVVQWDVNNPITDLEENAKQCAIIHVEGIIKSNPTYDDPECEDDIYKQVICNKPFWQEVLTILKNRL